MDNILKGIVIAAGVLLTVILIGVGFYIARETKHTSTNGLNQLNIKNMEGQYTELALYDGLSVSGTEVIYIMNKYETRLIFMCVKTRACISAEGIYYNYSYNNEELQPAGNYRAEGAAKEEKINKMGKFECKIYKNKSDVITGMFFTQK